MRLEFLREALEELEDAVDYYISEAPEGIADRFLSRVEAAASLIEAHPRVGSIWSPAETSREIRRVVVRGFPYAVLYQLEPTPAIIGIAHERRDPRRWVERAQSA